MWLSTMSAIVNVDQLVSIRYPSRSADGQFVLNAVDIRGALVPLAKNEEFNALVEMYDQLSEKLTD